MQLVKCFRNNMSMFSTAPSPYNMLICKVLSYAMLCLTLLCRRLGDLIWVMNSTTDNKGKHGFKISVPSGLAFVRRVLIHIYLTLRTLNHTNYRFLRNTGDPCNPANVYYTVIPNSIIICYESLRDVAAQLILFFIPPHCSTLQFEVNWIRNHFLINEFFTAQITTSVFDSKYSYSILLYLHWLSRYASAQK